MEETGAWTWSSSRAARWGVLIGVVGLLAGMAVGLRGRLPVAEYYTWLSTPSIMLTGPLGDLADAINIPLLSAVLLGLIGAISPCQISTNVAALAYTSRELGTSRRMALLAGVYVLGKMSVYAILGGVVIGLGVQLDRVSVPVIVIARKALGPLLILIGLMMLDVIRIRLAPGQRVSRWLAGRAEGRGVFGAYLLGVAFSFAFCPTLFWLFFGLLVPMALASAGGIVYAPAFALGTSVPLLALVALTVWGTGDSGAFVRRMRRLDRWVQPAVGGIFLLAGFNEFILYWLV